MTMHLSRRKRHILLLGTVPGLLFCLSSGSSGQVSGAAPLTNFGAATCAALAAQPLSGVPVVGLHIKSSKWHEGGLTIPSREGQSAPLPAHCEVEGNYGEHRGADGSTYRTGFRMRLPQDWNGRFLFQGGGGSNGVVGDAIGPNGPGNRPAIMRGYAVIAQDSGHDNSVNFDPAKGGELVFGRDPRARADYGHASLNRSYKVGLFLIRAAYGRAPTTKLFWGCSKGGQEGMAFAQRYPTAFDGIVAMAPGFALPRAAIAQAWDVQQFASILKADGIVPSGAGLKTAIRADQMKIVTATVAKVCDADDGVVDGIIGAIGKCTSARVMPELRKRQCSSLGQTDCLQASQIDALGRVIGGPRSSSGKALYSAWPWDLGLAEPGWRAWKLGLADGPIARNIALGGGSLAAVFMAPPTELPNDPERILAWQLAFDFDRDPPRIYQISEPYTTSPWIDVGMRSTDLSAFKAHGGKMIVPHGMSDPVFSAYDTIDWWRALNNRNHGQAANFVRVFPVPGMNHCGGGQATDRFDSLGALEDWVLNQRAPDAIPASAGPMTPWPGRKRPLCAYPTIAMRGPGDSFTCSAALRPSYTAKR